MGVCEDGEGLVLAWHGLAWITFWFGGVWRGRAITFYVFFAGLMGLLEYMGGCGEKGLRWWWARLASWEGWTWDGNIVYSRDRFTVKRG